MNLLKAVAACIAFAGVAALAQTTVTTSGGTANTIPLYTGSSTVGDSTITQLDGNVGIGTTAPEDPLTIYTAGGASPIGVMSIDVNTFSTYPNAAQSYFFRVRDIGGNTTPFYIEGDGNVGIGTTTPGAKLDVAGIINGRNFSIPDTGPTPQWAQIGTFTAGQSGETIRITAFIHNGYNASNDQDSTYFITFKTSNGDSVDGNGFAGNGSWYAIGLNNAIPSGAIKWVANTAGVNASSFTLYISLPYFTHGSHYSVSVDQGASWANVGTFASDPGAASSTVMIPLPQFDIPYGNVGIGTSNPGAALEINGNVKLSSGSGASITFADGTVQSTAYTGVSCGGDYAESVDVQGEKNVYEPGDVLVISGASGSDVEKAREPYSTMVAGIYSTKPGYVGRRQTGPKSPNEVPMAMVGIVPTKVSAENGPIHRGDLLVSSSTPGYAMKGTDRSRMLGAVVGKAMGNLSSGKGVMEVLVTLQ